VSARLGRSASFVAGGYGRGRGRRIALAERGRAVECFVSLGAQSNPPTGVIRYREKGATQTSQPCAKTARPSSPVRRSAVPPAPYGQRDNRVEPANYLHPGQAEAAHQAAQLRPAACDRPRAAPSLTAAATRSSSISGSFRVDRLRLDRDRDDLAGFRFAFTVTIPPPAEASTVSAAASSWRSSHLGLHLLGLLISSFMSIDIWKSFPCYLVLDLMGVELVLEQ